MKLEFNLKNLMIALIIFIIEILIATTFKDIFFVRAYLGDVFVVMLMYYFVKSFVKVSPTKLIIGLVIFSFVIEFLQYFHFGELLGFKDNKVVMIVLGNSFSWIDLICYLAGGIILYLIEVVAVNRKTT